MFTCCGWDIVVLAEGEGISNVYLSFEKKEYIYQEKYFTHYRNNKLWYGRIGSWQMTFLVLQVTVN